MFAGKSHTVRKSLCNLLNGNTQSLQRPGSSVLVTWVNCMSVSSAGEVYAQVAATATAGCSNDWQHQQHYQQQDEQPDTLSACDDKQQHQQREQQSISFAALLDCLQQQQVTSSHSSKASSKTTPAPKRYRAKRTRGSSSTSDSNPGTTTTSSTSSSLQSHIIVLDEVDNIAKKSLSDLVQLFKLPYEAGVQVLAVGIANSIDLTERTLPELKLQLVTPRLITFSAYTTTQLAAILDSLLQQLPCK